MKSFDFWVQLDGHKIADEMYGIGIINGLHFAEIDQFHDELKDMFEDNFEYEDFPPHCTIDLVANNVVFQEGQMSLPETGQWDFPPHYEMDISVKKVTNNNN